jgi:DnaA-homolog protein
MKGAQLALPVQLSQAPAFDNFFPGPNAPLVQTLRAFVADRALPAIWLYGLAHSGRTHLLHAAVRAAGAGAVYERADTARFDSLGDAAFLALDDVDAPVGEADTALALLRLIDHRRTRGLPLLLAAGSAPSRVPVALPDLRTRLDAMLLLGLKPLRESDRLELLRLQAAERGLELAEDAATWLLAHLQRDAGTLIAALDLIDRAALSAKRRATLPFVQQVLQAPPPAPASARTSSTR